MLFVHENNIDKKIIDNYKGKGMALSHFKNTYYLPFKESMLSLDFMSEDIDVFREASNLFNLYYKELHKMANINNITSQSKLESTLLEELSVYLFARIPEVVSGKLNFYNKAIFAGLKINQDLSLDIIKKDVDFCIGRKIVMSIEEQQPVTLTIPVVAVEVKTYLDATMFGEVKSSSKTLKSATPNSKAYVLMGYKALADEHIVAARQDSTLDEMFVLREGEGKPIDPIALYIYWREITSAIANITRQNSLNVPGRLLAYNDGYKKILEELGE